MIGQAKEPADPKPTASDGRSNKGRFGSGNKFGRGNPNHSHIQKLREAAAKAVTPAKIASLMNKLHELGMAGDVAAAKEYFERSLGKAIQPVDVTSGGEAVTFTLQIGHLNGESSQN